MTILAVFVNEFERDAELAQVLLSLITQRVPACGGTRAITASQLEVTMLWTLSIILILLWLLGFVSSYTMGGFIHILLVIALVVVLLRIIQGRRVLL